MTAEEVLKRDDFQRCLAFHGHLCPGLSIGYRAARAAMDWLDARRSEDEEVVAIVETDACSADAVQVLTGCTFGKGNFICRDHGKMVVTLLSRDTGRGVRVAMRPGAFAPDPEHMALIQKITRGEADAEEKARFRERHHARSRDILAMGAEDLFKIEAVATELPPRARIAPSEPCAACGEPTMATKMEEVEGRRICRDCAGRQAVERSSMAEQMKIASPTLRPVGVVHSEIKQPMLAATDEGLALGARMDKIREAHRRNATAVAELVIEPELEGLLDGVDGFSHILVLYWPHLVPEDRRGLRRVHPMGRKDLPRQGVFATCSPARPNPVLVSAVPLLARKGRVLQVQGLDAVDGSPIVDIKPYVPLSMKIEDAGVPEWMTRIHRDLMDEPGGKESDE